MNVTRTRWLLAAFALIGVASCGGDDSPDASSGGSEGPETDSTTAVEPPSSDSVSSDAATIGSADPASSDSRCERTVPGSQLTFGVYAPATQIDPTRVNGGLVGGHELAAVYDVLFRFDHETNEFIPHLAESVTANDDATVWTLTLRQGITFADGTSLTAQVVSDSIDRFLEPGAVNASGGYLQGIDRRVVDERTLRFTLQKPWAEFPMVLADEPGMVVNTKAIGADPASFAAEPPPAAGVGPYVVERNAPGEALVLEAREDYWGGPVCIEELRFVFVPGDEATYDAFRNGDLDVAFVRLPTVVQQSRDDGVPGFFIHVDSGRAMAINHAEGHPGADPRIREAIALALDTEVMNERVYQGTAKVSSALIGDGSRYESGAIDEVPADPERAAQLVEEAKADGYDGKLDILCATSTPGPDLALTSEGLLEAVGFEVTTSVLPINDQLARALAGDFDVACWGVSADAANATETMVRNFRSGSSGNRIGYASAQMDAALDELMAAATPAEQHAAMAKVNNIYVEDHVMVSVASIEEGVVWQPGVEGIVPTASSVMLLHDAAIDR